jgi:hypothetical protein
MGTGDLLSDQQAHSPETQKVIRLADYLLRLATLRTKLIRDIAEYEKILWVSSVPHERGCFTQAWGRDEEHESDEWLEMQNRREPELPAVPPPCKDWVNLSEIRYVPANPPADILSLLAHGHHRPILDRLNMG